MCRVGDIIVVQNYIGEDGEVINRQHSFVVVDDNSDRISGLNYDLVTTVMSSFKNEEQKEKKLRYEENIPIESDDIISNNKNSREGYIKADQLHYFDKSKIDYYVFGQVNPDLLDELIKIIVKLEVENKLKQNTHNLERELVENQ